MLVRYLVRRRMLSPSVVARILSWAFAYKTRLPQNEAWVRGLVFRAFAGRPVAEVNGFLRDFYDQVIDRRFRADAEAEMAAHEEAGHAVVCVSATFEPIIAAAMERLFVGRHLGLGIGAETPVDCLLYTSAGILPSFLRPAAALGGAPAATATGTAPAAMARRPA